MIDLLLQHREHTRGRALNQQFMPRRFPLEQELLVAINFRQPSLREPLAIVRPDGFFST